MNDMPYNLRVLEAYEDEVAGAAYFDALAQAYPQKSDFFGKCAALERATAEQLVPLLRKYTLMPRTQAALDDQGARAARGDAGGDWRTLLQESSRSYARYVSEFKALEAIGPPDDQAILAALTAHEIRLIEWMQAEAPTG